MSSSSYPRAGIAATYQERRRELLRELLLDGARARLLDSRWEDVSMLAVATFAGVGRGALYKEFETRRNLIRALIRREAGRLSESWSEPLRAGGAQPARAFEETFERFLAASVENGLLVAVLRPGEAELLRLAASHKASVLTRLGSAMIEAWPLLGRSEAEHLSEWLFRFALSVVRAPATPSTARHVRHRPDRRRRRQAAAEGRPAQGRRRERVRLDR